MFMLRSIPWKQLGALLIEHWRYVLIAVFAGISWHYHGRAETLGQRNQELLNLNAVCKEANDTNTATITKQQDSINQIRAELEQSAASAQAAADRRELDRKTTETVFKRLQGELRDAAQGDDCHDSIAPDDFIDRVFSD